MRRCLLVEDDPIFVEILSRVVTSAGLDPTNVRTAPAAITALRQRDYDIILLDLHLAEQTDGGQVLAFIRRTKPHLLPRVLCVTSSPGAMVRLEVDVPCVNKGDVRGVEEKIRAMGVW